MNRWNRGRPTIDAMLKAGELQRVPANREWADRLVEIAKEQRANLRSSVKRFLFLNGYPPDQPPAAIKLVIEQME